MEVDLNTIKEAHLATSALGDRISKVLNDDNLDPQAKVQEIADDIYRLCSSTDPKEKISTILWNLWAVFIEKVQTTPGHFLVEALVNRRQRDGARHILVETLVNLRQRDGAVVNLIEGSFHLWRDLPILPQYMREIWFDPTQEEGILTGDNYRRWCDMDGWCDLNWFAARLMGAGYVAWISFAIWGLRIALENPNTYDSQTIETRLIVAALWIIHSGDVLFKEMSSADLQDKDTARAIKPGPLCEKVLPRSRNRWDFWKNRFRELSGNFHFKITMEVAERMSAIETQ